MLIIATVAVWGLPKEKDISTASEGFIKELYHKVDWAGSIIISGGLALLAYILA